MAEPGPPCHRALHLISGRSFTGPAAATLTDVRALCAAGRQAWLGGRTGSSIEKGAELYSTPFIGGFKLGRGAARLFRLPNDIRRLRKVIKDHEIDVVHLHRSDDQLLTQLAQKKSSPFSLVRTWHRDPSSLPRALLRKSIRETDGFCCVSEEHARILQEAGASSAIYIPVGVDTRHFKPPQRDSQDTETIRIGLVGRWKEKEDRGQIAFLKILSNLTADRPWRGVLLGRGEGQADLERRIREHPFKDRIALEIAGDQFHRQVAGLHIGIALATGSDGTSRAAAELLACGVPLLLADIPGLCEFSVDNTATRKFPPGQLEAFASELETLLADNAKRQAMSAAARQCALTRHDLSIRGQALARLYESASH